MIGIDISNWQAGFNQTSEICLPLATMRDDDTIVVKVNDIEVVWN